MSKRHGTNEGEYIPPPPAVDFGLFTDTPTAHQVLQRASDAGAAGKEDAVAGRLTDAEQADILRIIEKVARAFPHGFSWESVCEWLPPGLQDKVAFTSAGGALLTRACRLGTITATDITVKSSHAAAKGRRILLYRRAGA